MALLPQNTSVSPSMRMVIRYLNGEENVPEIDDNGCFKLSRIFLRSLGLFQVLLSSSSSVTRIFLFRGFDREFLKWTFTSCYFLCILDTLYMIWWVNWFNGLWQRSMVTRNKASSKSRFSYQTLLCGNERRV